MLKCAEVKKLEAAVLINPYSLCVLGVREHGRTCRSLKGCRRRPRGSLALLSRAWVWGMLVSVHLKVLISTETRETHAQVRPSNTKQHEHFRPLFTDITELYLHFKDFKNCRSSLEVNNRPTVLTADCSWPSSAQGWGWARGLLAAWGAAGSSPAAGWPASGPPPPAQGRRWCPPAPQTAGRGLGMAGEERDVHI